MEVLRIICSGLLCVLEQTRVDISCNEFLKRVAQLGVIGPIVLWPARFLASYLESYLMRIIVGKWVIDCCLTPSEQFYRYNVPFGRDNDSDFRFVLDQHTNLDCYSASSLKQMFAAWHVAPLVHMMMIPSQPVFDLTTKWWVLSGEAVNITEFIVWQGT